MASGSKHIDAGQCWTELDRLIKIDRYQTTGPSVVFQLTVELHQNYPKSMVEIQTYLSHSSFEVILNGNLIEANTQGIVWTRHIVQNIAKGIGSKFCHQVAPLTLSHCLGLPYWHHRLV